MTEWTGASGTHWGLIGSQVAMLIERSVAAETLHELTAAHSVQEMLDALVHRGIEQLPGFCLVGFDDTQITAYVRGGFSLRAEANWHDALTETGQGVRTWRELSVDGVSRFAMFGPDDWHRAEVPLRSFERDRDRIFAGVQGLSYLVCEQLTTHDVPLMTTTSGASQSGAETGGEPPANTDALDAVFGDTFVAAEVVSEQNLGHTLLLPGGEEVALGDTTLLGRNPKAEPGSGVKVVPVFDPNGNISRTHARITLREGSAFIEDLGSTNGTLVVTQSEELLLAPRVTVALNPGDRVILGGDAQIEYRAGA